ncbi:DNA sulfur modification protein DndB [Streptomyces sp. ND04-05B]|uniref:DNA sulfur modification protein DndB n=1 Tax=Streptomyces sp. ND04-05B TaxID=3028693 RepID=UPI0029AD188F|nr:DNA sulfur modification protein DndB [Streptomyces sp. ND04-05B]MDX3065040.1 DNA sulfur modification protein DndB [Streptomyces sp. ND04-05B]
MFGSGTKLTFRDYVQGTWGTFATPAGRVDYIMTKARLGEVTDDPERQLTKSLAPVREVMEAGDLDFNQLLQRDLDDHRVAVKLIPYLLDLKPTGPAFFPPIVAVLLPFRGKRPSYFEPLGQQKVVPDDGARWQQEQAGTSFRVQRLIGDDDRLHPASVGKLWWNKTESQLVVLDGQHRAMALLAVERTMTKSWQDSGGARFRSFYENQVTQALHDFGNVDLSRIEVPVTVCWFPEETGEEAKPHEAARKLFVDVNKEARPPSDSRIILLSDAELSNVLTRRMLSELRNDTSDSLLPIYAVEYDNPEVNSTRPARWSVLTNIHLLKFAVDRCVFGPPKYLNNVAQKIGGRLSQTELDTFMQRQLDLTSLFPDQFEDGGFTYQREKIGNTEFPLGRMDVISDRFAATWGRAILTLLSRTAPYAAHAKALTQSKDDWHIDDTGLTLAHDALFSGVGVFWTLRDSYEHYLEKKAAGLKAAKSDVIRAWEALKGREETFETYRARAYLDSGRTAALKQSKAAYAVFNTHACQLGVVMTLGSLWELRKEQPGGVDINELPQFADALVAAWNAYFALEQGKAKDRRLAFNKNEVNQPLNQIANMDTPQAVYFRYFWLQVLDTPEAWEHIAPWFANRTAFENMLSTARGLYLELCQDQQFKALKISKPGVVDTKLRPEAEKAARAALGRALKEWFYGTDEPYKSWLAQFAQEGAPTQQLDDAAGDAEDLGGSAEGAEDEPVTSVDDLLGE